MAGKIHFALKGSMVRSLNPLVVENVACRRVMKRYDKRTFHASFKKTDVTCERCLANSFSSFFSSEMKGYEKRFQEKRIGYLYHFNKSGKRVEGRNRLMKGNCTGLYGDCSGIEGLCDGFRGDCTGVKINLNRLKLSEEDRKRGVPIKTLIR